MLDKMTNKGHLCMSTPGNIWNLVLQQVTVFCCHSKTRQRIFRQDSFLADAMISRCFSYFREAIYYRVSNRICCLIQKVKSVSSLSTDHMLIVCRSTQNGLGPHNAKLKKWSSKCSHGFFMETDQIERSLNSSMVRVSP